MPEVHRKNASTKYGEVAYLESGDGPAALFVHGVFVNSRLWENAIRELSDERRCIAVDLPSHGRTRVETDEFSLTRLTEIIEDFCESLDLGRIDLVANDTGGAIAQIMATRFPERIRTLTLTNCDVHTNFPPEAFKPTIELAESGGLAPFVQGIATDADAARGSLAVGYQYPDRLESEKILDFFAPFANENGARNLERFLTSATDGALEHIEADLKRLNVPTLVVWGTDDQFFDKSWAYWLRDNLPGVTEVVEIDGGKLFFVDERADELVPLIRKFWAENPES